MKKVVNKSVDLNLIGINGNAFNIMGAFSKQARRESFSKAEINAVLDEAKNGDYNHLLAKIENHCEPLNFEDDE